MFRKILVPLDGSRLAARIIRPLRRLLEVDAEVTLLRVVEPGGAEETARAHVAEAAMRTQLAEVRDAIWPCARSGVELVHGDPADEVVRFARETGQDLVAMATHGRSGVERWVRGSVAERVLRECDVPLLLCNPHGLEAHGDGPFQRVLVPLDGSDVADRILPHAEAIARLHGSRVTLLRVEPLVLTEFPSPLAEGSLWDPAAVERALHPQRDRLVAAGVQAEVRGVYGVVAAEILEAARGADLLAMASHGRSGLSRWWFGSVAEQVLRHATCPLLVVRPARDEAARPGRAMTSASEARRAAKEQRARPTEHGTE